MGMEREHARKEYTMQKLVSLQWAIYLMILWFYAGRQLGHVGAKYARSKQSSRIIMAVLCVLALGFTMLLISTAKVTP